MLVLSRKPGEKIVIGNSIAFIVVQVKGDRVRVGIEAPEQVRILRAELGSWLDEAADRDWTRWIYARP